MSAVNECFPVRCMKSLHGTHRSYRSPSQHQKQTNFPSIRVSQSRNPGERRENALNCYSDADCEVWSVFAELLMEINALFWWSGSRKWMRLELNYCKARAAPLSLSSGPSEARARERERERESCPLLLHPVTCVCVTVSCVWEYIENPIKLTRSVKKDS